MSVNRILSFKKIWPEVPHRCTATYLHSSVVAALESGPSTNAVGEMLKASEMWWLQTLPVASFTTLWLWGQVWFLQWLWHLCRCEYVVLSLLGFFSCGRDMLSAGWQRFKLQMWQNSAPQSSRLTCFPRSYGSFFCMLIRSLVQPPPPLQLLCNPAHSLRYCL